MFVIITNQVTPYKKAKSQELTAANDNLISRLYCSLFLFLSIDFFISPNSSGILPLLHSKLQYSIPSSDLFRNAHGIENTWKYFKIVTVHELTCL